LPINTSAAGSNPPNHTDLITFASFHRLVELVEGNPLPFASMYTLGNILALFSSMFLCGPARQLKLMMDEKRKVTAIIYVSCLVATIVVIFIPMQQLAKLLIIFILVLTQMASGLWYNLSYIPFGRRTFIKCFKNLVGVGDDGGGGGVLGGTSSRTLGV
jgi:hypothetical protein